MISTLLEVDVQAILEAFAEAYHSLGLNISVKKTEVHCQFAPNQAPVAPAININGESLKTLDDFSWLRSHQSSEVDIDANVLHHLWYASNAFRDLRLRILHDQTYLPIQRFFYHLLGYYLCLYT